MNYFKHEQALVHEEAAIGDGTRIWAFTNIQAGAVIGDACNICDGSFVEKGAVIGNHVTIKHHVAVFDGVGGDICAVAEPQHARVANMTIVRIRDLDAIMSFLVFGPPLIRTIATL